MTWNWGEEIRLAVKITSSGAPPIPVCDMIPLLGSIQVHDKMEERKHADLRQAQILSGSFNLTASPG